MSEVSPPFEGGRALRNCPVGNFSERASLRESQPTQRRMAGVVDCKDAVRFTRYIFSEFKKIKLGL